MSGAEEPGVDLRGHRRRLLGLLREAPPDLGRGLDGAGSAAGVGDLVDTIPAGRALRARLRRLCDLAVTELAVSGAGVTLMGSVTAGRDGHRVQLWATGAMTEQLEDLQLTAGEGPCLEAYATGRPVLAADLAAESHRWLGFTSDALAVGARALFSLPLQIGAARLGTLDLHREWPGRLSSDQLAEALALAGLATEAVLELAWEDPDQPASGSTPGSVGWLPDVHADVHQASGMVAAREHIAIGPALLRIRGYAFSHSVPITEVARRVLARELALTELPLPAPPEDP